MKKTDLPANFSYLLKLLSCALNDTEPPKPNANIDWALVFSMAKAHSVAGMVFCTVKKLKDEDKPSQDMYSQFKEIYEYQLLSDFNIDFETEAILSEMTEKKLYAMPLKGYILKHDYPIPAMRTMSDVDILYKQSQQQQVKEFFLSRGYIFESRLNQEMDFRKGDINHYEVQANLVSEERASYDYFSKIWDRVSFNNDFIGKMTLEDFYLYLIEHLASHFSQGGVGVRMFMDIYVFLKAHKAKLNRDYVKEKLKEFKLYEFSQKAEALSFQWFEENSEPDIFNEVARFIMSCGTFGLTEYAVVGKAVKREESTGKRSTAFGNILHKLFPSYSHISVVFPKVKKYKFLYPFYIPVLWFKRIFVDRNINTKGIGNYLKASDSETAKKYKSVMNSMGLK